MALATLNNVSALDTIVGPYSAGWSQAGFTSQQLVSAAQAAATGGTYALHAPVEESAPEVPVKAPVKARAPRKPAVKKTVAKTVAAEKPAEEEVVEEEVVSDVK